MIRKPLFWIGPLALLSLVSIGVVPTDAATTAHKSIKSTRAPKRTLYSAERSLSRKAKLARARAVAMAREMAETTLPRYKVDASGDLVPDVRAAAAIIYDPETNQVLWEENSQSQRSIASITKVMTATVFFEDNPDLTQPVTVAKSDVFQASTTHLHANDHVTADDLLHLLLIASDNAAARALARVSPYGSEGFVRRMNEKAAELGLESTRYADPSGLLSENVSSAYDMARLITHASGDERIASIMRTPTSTRSTAAGGRSRSAARITCSAGPTSMCGRGRPASFRKPATAWPRFYVFPRAVSRSPSSSSGRVRTPAGSWRRGTCSAGFPARRRRSSRPPPLLSSSNSSSSSSNSSRSHEAHEDLVGFCIVFFCLPCFSWRRTSVLHTATLPAHIIQHSRAASPRRRAAASRSSRPPPSPAASRGGRRTPSDTGGRRRTRTRGSDRRASRTT